jgi:TonB family protein
MTIRSLSVLLCGLLVACIAPPREPAERIVNVEDSARRDAPATAIRGGATLGGSGGAMQGAESGSSSGSGEVLGGSTVRARPIGAWHPLAPTRWKSALENYVPSVREGNRVALNTARSAFAGYLNAMHNRIHPLFADSFLAALDQLPTAHLLNNPRLSTEVEIILDQESGDLVRMGVTKASGITAFDVAVLDSVRRAAPFGPPPHEILSPDGNVYVHWEFHRNSEACSTFNARPFLLKVQPKAAAD